MIQNHPTKWITQTKAISKYSSLTSVGNLTPTDIYIHKWFDRYAPIIANYIIALREATIGAEYRLGIISLSVGELFHLGYYKLYRGKNMNLQDFFTVTLPVEFAI